MNLTVSVIIPTKDRAGDLVAAVRSLFLQTVTPNQLIILDQSASDESERQISALLAEASAKVRDRLKLNHVRDTTVTGLASARNRSLEMAHADVCLFLDDDVVLEPNFLEELLTVYSNHPEAAGVSGIVTNYPLPDRFTRWWSAVFVRGVLHDDRQPVYWSAGRLRDQSPIQVSRLGGGLMSFRTEAIRGVRFDEALEGVSDGEDVDFCARLGPKAVLLISPRARLVHNQSPSGRERNYWVRRHGRALYYLYRKNWKHGVVNRLSFVWLNVGYAFVATLGSARRLSLDPWRALCDARRDAKEIQRRARARDRDLPVQGAA